MEELENCKNEALRETLPHTNKVSIGNYVVAAASPITRAWSFFGRMKTRLISLRERENGRAKSSSPYSLYSHLLFESELANSHRARFLS